jgi:hydroxysqualene dehydroxylase
MSPPDVIVIGAGFAGLSAAVRLARNGARVLVVEERKRLGGRATAFPDPQSGEVVDNGQHVLFGCYHETFAFLGAIGAADGVILDSTLDLEILDRSGRRSRLHSAPLPPPFHLVVGLLRWPALGMRDRLAALRLGRVLRRLHRERQADARAKARAYVGDAQAKAWAYVRDGASADPSYVGPSFSSGIKIGGTVDEWLTAHGQTPRLHEVLWEPLAVAALNQSPAVASAAPFIEVLARMFGGSARDAAIGLPRRPLDHLFAEPARRYLEQHGHAVRCGLPARVVVDGDRAVAVDLRGERITTGAVVSSVPWFSFAGVAGHVPALEPIASAAGHMASSPIVTVNLWLDRRIATASFVGFPGRRFQWMFDKARLFGEQASHVSLVASGADEIVGFSNEALIDLARTELSQALPGPWSVIRATAVREKRATFSLAPGQPPRPAPATPIRQFFLAGDWTDTGLPATIESAVLSGHRAADLAAKPCPS